MGQRGPAPKPDSKRQSHKQPVGATADLVLIRGSEPPKAATKWLVGTRRMWDGFWGSPIAGGLVEWSAHEGPIRRYFDLIDERARLVKAYWKEPLVLGSQGQRVENPLARRLSHVEDQLLKLEDRFGLNVDALLRAGVQFGEARKSLEDLAGVIDDDSEDPREDPRRLAKGKASSNP